MAKLTPKILQRLPFDLVAHKAKATQVVTYLQNLTWGIQVVITTSQHGKVQTKIVRKASNHNIQVDAHNNPGWINQFPSIYNE